jgi:PAS domain S-box-containing protein
MTELTGYTIEEINRSGWYQTVYPDPDIQEKAIKRMEKMRHGNDLRGEEWEITRSDGNKKWLSISTSIVKDENNTVHVMAVMIDITDRKQVEEELISQQDFIKEALDAQKDTFFIFDPLTGQALQWNKAFENISGYSNEEISSLKAPESYYSKEDLEKASKYIESILRGGAGTVELQLICKDGHRLPTEYSASIIRDAEENPKTVISIGRDISERKKAEKEKAELERRLRQAHKMEAIGTMAGGIAHDFNNMLAIIIGNAEMALHDIPEDSFSRHNIDQVLDASLRAKDLVKQILAFSRQTDKTARPINIIQATEDSLKLLRSTIPTSVEISNKFELDERFIKVDPTQFHQLIINLCTNATQAMHDKGVLKIGLTEINLTKDSANQLGKEPGSYIRLSVSDTGEGMDPATIDRIFDPFYTTREVGQGTGMGLSVVHGIVESHGGFITVESEPGKGSTFHVFFPVAEKMPIDDEIEESRTLPIGNERILFVDDEKALTVIGSKMLEQLGYTVTTFTSSTVALEIFKSQQDGFDLIITDMAMPDLTGKELAAELLKVRPDIPIILCTGYSSIISKENAEEFGIREFCMKPWNMKQLAKTVRKVLDEK